jgi:glycosyltransferase involved in cell wall biosynthesis
MSIMLLQSAWLSRSSKTSDVDCRPRASGAHRRGEVASVLVLLRSALAVKSAMEPAVSVIIPARDAAPTLARTLEALERQTVGVPFEVIVVDDGSQDATADIVARHDHFVSLVRNTDAEGPGAARNRGVAQACAPVLAFTDADCFPTAQWVRRGLEALESADLVQGRVEPDPSVPRTPFDRSLGVEGDGGYYQTANLFVRREVFDAVGGFRDWALEQPGRRQWSSDTRRARATRTPIGEDTQFGWAVRRRGFRTAYAADALVHHAVVPGSLSDAMADRWHWTRDMPGLVRRVPELREQVLYRRLFFDDWSAQFDLAVAGIILAAASRRPRLLLATLPYLRRVAQESHLYRGGADSPLRGLGRAAQHALGAPVVNMTTLAGFIAGSIAWRSLVL